LAGFVEYQQKGVPQSNSSDLNKKSSNADEEESKALLPESAKRAEEKEKKG
jgi:hypothetical protein